MKRTLFHSHGAKWRRTCRRGLALAAGGILWAGCRASPPEPAHPVDMRCLLVQGSATDTVTIGITGTVRPLRNFGPPTDAERVLSRHLYETLVEIDCAGHIQPGLAAAWRRERDGMDWVFELREEATFADGAAVTAAHLEAAWGGRTGGAVKATIDSVVALGEREIRVTMKMALPSVPHLFAGPDFAVQADRGGIQSWPLGTRGYAVGAATDTEVILVPVAAMEGDELPAIRLVFGARDLRDLVDQDADLVITRDPGVVDYARSASGYRSIPLPWSRVYGLLASSDPPGVEAWRGAAAALSADLAGNEVRVPQEQYWWDGLDRCTASAPTRSGLALRSNRIVYPSNDPWARDLAERLVALQAVVPLQGGELGAVTAVGLSEMELARAMAVGSERGYMVELATSVLDPCIVAVDLSQSAPWIGARDVGRSIIPLAETRFTAIVRDGAGPFALGRDGLPFFWAAMGGAP